MQYDAQLPDEAVYLLQQIFHKGAVLLRPDPWKHIHVPLSYLAWESRWVDEDGMLAADCTDTSEYSEGIGLKFPSKGQGMQGVERTGGGVADGDGDCGDSGHVCGDGEPH